MNRPPKSNKPKTNKRIFLYTFGVALIITAIVIVLRGTGVISAVPNFVIWALVLATLGIGILGGIRSI